MFHRLRSVFIASALLTAVPGSALAGEHPHKWWHSSEIRGELGLTSAQTQRIESIFQATLPRLKAEKALLDKYERELSALVAAGTAGEAALLEAVDRVEAARSAANKTRTLMLYRMRQVLSPEQRAKLEAYYARRAQERDPDRRRDSTRRSPSSAR